MVWLHRGSGKVVSGIGAATEASVFSYDSSQHTHLGGPPISAEDIVVAANDTEIIDTSSFSNVSVTSGGSGSGSTGGFAIGQHIKYTGNNPRSFSTYPQDLRYYKEIHLTTLIIGTSSNGGENADNGEDFAIEYSTNGGSSFTNIITIDSEDSRFAKSGGGSLILNLPQGAKTANTIVRFRQTSSSGSNFDQYGLSGFTFKADEAYWIQLLKDHCSPLVDLLFLNLLFAMLVLVHSSHSSVLMNVLVLHNLLLEICSDLEVKL